MAGRKMAHLSGSIKGDLLPEGESGRVGVGSPGAYVLQQLPCCVRRAVPACQLQCLVGCLLHTCMVQSSSYTADGLDCSCELSQGKSQFLCLIGCLLRTCNAQSTGLLHLWVCYSAAAAASQHLTSCACLPALC